MVTLSDARSVLGASATQSTSCSADDCNYVTDGGVGALTIAASTGASQQDFATSTQGYQTFSGTGDAAATKVNTNGTGEVTFLHGSLLINISVRIAGPSGTVTPVTASALQRLATTADGRIP